MEYRRQTPVALWVFFVAVSAAVSESAPDCCCCRHHPAWLRLHLQRSPQITVLISNGSAVAMYTSISSTRMHIARTRLCMMHVGTDVRAATRHAGREGEWRGCDAYGINKRHAAWHEQA